ncbi:MAG: hypothetical protein V1668_03765 [Patescibacteria group bacterium]
MRTFNNLFLVIIAIAILLSVNVLAQPDEVEWDQSPLLPPPIKGSTLVDFEKMWPNLPDSFRVIHEYAVPDGDGDSVWLQTVLTVQVNRPLTRQMQLRILEGQCMEYFWAQCDSAGWYQRFSPIQADGSLDSFWTEAGHSLLPPYTYPDDEDGRRWFRAYVEEIFNLIDDECMEDFQSLYTSLPDDSVSSKFIDYPWGGAVMTVTIK